MRKPICPLISAISVNDSVLGGDMGIATWSWETNLFEDDRGKRMLPSYDTISIINYQHR